MNKWSPFILSNIKSIFFLCSRYITLLAIVALIYIFVDLNECAEDHVDDQCKHGSCRNAQFSYTCECYDGYKGDKCDVENDKDQANGMINNGYMFFLI